MFHLLLKTYFLGMYSKILEYIFKEIQKFSIESHKFCKYCNNLCFFQGFYLDTRAFLR